MNKWLGLAIFGTIGWLIVGGMWPTMSSFDRTVAVVIVVASIAGTFAGIAILKFLRRS